MSLRSEFTQLRSELDTFLCAPVWEDGHGASPSVLSALARLDIDPWEEAMRLAALPRESAVGALTTILRRLPRSCPETSDVGPAANRLVMLLPRGRTLASIQAGGDPAEAAGTSTGWLLLVVVVLLAALAIGNWWL